MKKVFQIKLKNITRLMAMVIVTSLVTFTGCKNYDDDISKLKTDVASLQTSVNSMTYIKSIALDPTTGVLTIKDSKDAVITYNAKNYVTYDITLTGNNLMVNGVNKGTVALPALTFNTTTGKLMSGTTEVADLAGWLKSGLTVVNGFLTINGLPTTVAIPAAAGTTVTIKNIEIVGNDLKVTYSDNTTKTLPNVVNVATTVTTTGNTLTINGVDTGVKIVDTFGTVVVAGKTYLTVNNVTTSVELPAGNKTSVIYSQVGGVIQSLTITDAAGVTATVKVNPSRELLAGILFVPRTINVGYNAIEQGYLNNVSTGSVDPFINAVSLFNTNDLTFRFNPTSADLTNTTDWKIINNSAQFTGAYAPSMQKAAGDKTDLYTDPTSSFVNKNDGSGMFKLKVTYGNWYYANIPGAANYKSQVPTTETHYIALQNNSKDFYSNTANKSVVSDYIKVLPLQYYPAIRKDSTAFAGYKNGKVTTTDINDYINNTFATPAATDVDYELYYDAPLNTYNLYNYVVAAASKTLNSGTFNTLFKLNFGSLNNPSLTVPPSTGGDFTITFDSTTYKSLDGTQQSYFMTFDAANGKIKINQGSASIDRTPVVKATLKSKTYGTVLAVALIKFRIIRKAIEPKTYTYDFGAIDYNKLFKGNATINQNNTPRGITWNQINAIYTSLGISHDDFQQVYGGLQLKTDPNAEGIYVSTGSFANATGYVKNGNYTAAQLPTAPASLTQVVTLVNQLHQADIDSYGIRLDINPLTRFGDNTFTFVFTPADKVKYPVLTFVMKYKINAPVLDRTILGGYKDLLPEFPAPPTAVLTQGTNYDFIGAGYKMQLFLGEAFAYGLKTDDAQAIAGYRSTFGALTADKVDWAKHQFSFLIEPNKTQTGASLLYPPYADPANAYTNTSNTSSNINLVPRPSNAYTMDQAMGISSTAPQGILLNLTNKLAATEKSRTYKMNLYTYYPNTDLDSLRFNVRFENPITIAVVSAPGFVLEDQVSGLKDTLDVTPYYNVLFKGKIAVYKGQYSTQNNNTNVIASDFGITKVPSFPSLSYWFTAGAYSGITQWAAPAETSVLQWLNAGTTITTRTKVGTTYLRVETPYSITHSSVNDVIVKPGIDKDPVKRK